MKRDASALEETSFDLLIIGGGITGACVARDAASRGLSVALIEKHDFISATSAGPSKLIHGGLRYLAQGQVAVVREAARERRTLRRIAKKMEPISAIIKLRSNQVGAFSHISHDQDGVGFRIMLRNQQASPTSAEKAEMKTIEEFFLNTGFTYNPERQDNFETYQRKLVRDRLTLDAMCTQLVANQRGELTEFWAMETLEPSVWRFGGGTSG